MRAWIIVGFLVAAGLAAAAFLGGDAILSSEEAAWVVGGVYPNSKCLVAGDCDGFNYNITRQCPNPNGWCRTCRLTLGGEPAGSSPPIWGCRGGFPGCTCDYSGTTDCGQLWHGQCAADNSCMNLVPVGQDCSGPLKCADTCS